VKASASTPLKNNKDILLKDMQLSAFSATSHLITGSTTISYSTAESTATLANSYSTTECTTNSATNPISY